MIIAQEKLLLKSQRQLQQICRFVEQSVQDGRRMDEMERELFAQLLEVGRTLLEAFVAAQGDGDIGEEVERSGRRLRRLKDRHARRYLSIFGQITIERFVYATRERQKVEHAALDERLSLPASEFSYVLEDWQQRLCVQDSYGEAVTSLRTLLGVAPSQRAAE